MEELDSLLRVSPGSDQGVIWAEFSSGGSGENCFQDCSCWWWNSVSCDSRTCCQL